MNPNYFHQTYYEALDFKINAFQNVFFENLLIKVANSEYFSKEHTLVTEFYDRRSVPVRLKLHLKIFEEDCTKLPKADLQSMQAHL